MWDHPRSRGVYPSASMVLSTPAGSSPLARGLPALYWRNTTIDGIIPARAGFTRPSPSFLRTVLDHPRSRGVYGRRLMPLRSWSGSSPLARGLLTVADLRRRDGRIIPARAGFTHCVPSLMRRTPDHPRSRGVYGVGKCGGGCVVGSSPLARGLLPGAYF